MERFKHMILVGILVYTLQPLHAQVAVGGCDKVTVTQVPPYPYVLQGTMFKNCNEPIIEGECCKVALNPSQMLPLFTLQKLNAAGVWEQASTSGITSVFNLDPIDDHGVYRVQITTPYFSENQCGAASTPGDPQPAKIAFYSTNGSFLGYQGTYNNSPYPGNETYYTNRVIVGPTVPSDLALDWIEPPGSNAPFAYDIGQTVAIDVSDSKNYNYWWISLNQDDSPNYLSNGWTHGTIQEFNLSDFWLDLGNYSFEPWATYRLQWVIENYECRNGVHWPGTWNNLPQNLLICPAGTGCRLGMEQTAMEVSIYPNPATSWIRVDNLDASKDGLYLMTLHDLSGKLLQSVPLTEQDIPVHDLPSGMFIARITLDGQLVHTEKVIIGH